MLNKNKEAGVADPNYSPFQIALTLKRVQAGVSESEVCRSVGVSPKLLRQWKLRYLGLRPREVQHLILLENENRWLKDALVSLCAEHPGLARNPRLAAFRRSVGVC